MIDRLLLAGKERSAGSLLIVSYRMHQRANIIKDDLFDLPLINVVCRAIILAVAGVSTALVKLLHDDMWIACRISDLVRRLRRCHSETAVSTIQERA